MERDKMLENFIGIWRDNFPDYELKASDLKEPLALMGALVQVLDRLGVDRVILSESPEDNVNDSVQYYRDLLPVINMTRVVNSLVTIMPEMSTINMMHFLQPTVMTSQSILLLLFNLMMFNEEKLRGLAPYEDELFEKSEQVNRLLEHKHKLQEMLNEQAQEKAKRADRLEELERNTGLAEEEAREETAASNAEQRALDAAATQHRLQEALLDQKTAQRDAAQADLDKKKALRVYDADDVMTQVAQTARGVQEAEEQVRASRATLMQKEDSVRNLQTLKPGLDAANSLLREITNLAEALMYMKTGDLESESQEGELDVLQTELGELQAAERELQAARAELRDKLQHARGGRRREQAAARSALHEASEKSRQNSERCEQAARTTAELRRRTRRHEQDRARGLRHIHDIHDTLHRRLQSSQEMLMKQMVDLVKLVEEKQKKI